MLAELKKWRVGGKEGTELVSSIMSLHLQFELERAGAPLAGVTVKHGAFCEGHIAFCIYQYNCIGPGGGAQRIQT